MFLFLLGSVSTWEKKIGLKRKNTKKSTSLTQLKSPHASYVHGFKKNRYGKIPGEQKINLGLSKSKGIPKSSILIGFSIINHPFWGIPIFGNTHLFVQDTFTSLDNTRPLKAAQCPGPSSTSQPESFRGGGPSGMLDASRPWWFHHGEAWWFILANGFRMVPVC